MRLTVFRDLSCLSQLFVIYLCRIAFSGSILAQTCWRNTPCSNIVEPAFPGNWDQNIYAPASRTISPENILASDGTLISTYPNSVVLTSNGSNLVLDFGVEVGGIVTLQYVVNGSNHANGAIGLAFTESKYFIGQEMSDSSTKDERKDGALYANLTGLGQYSYSVPIEKLRGGFRYLTLFLLTDTLLSITISNITLELSIHPTWSNLRAYQGYFHSDDEALNSIWYAGAYTTQMCSVPINSGRCLVHSGWEANCSLGLSGYTTLVDGAKRDRTIWPADMGVSIPSMFVSLGDMESAKNALQAMYDYQNEDGSFGYSGPPMNMQHSDTYHMWTMIGTYTYFLYTDDREFLTKNWAKHVKGMGYICGKIDASTGLLNVTDPNDWAIDGVGGYASEAQIILYRTLTTGAELANWVESTSRVIEDSKAPELSLDWISLANTLRNATLIHCWDSSIGAFKMLCTSPNSTIYPQDTNSLAILFSIVGPNSTYAQSISTRLTKYWTSHGSVSPEYPSSISPFISSFEIQAHLIAEQSQRALDLIRTTWSWYLNDPNGTQSTFIERYSTGGAFDLKYDKVGFVSHAHGWSTGPTSALTFYILGLSLTSPAGSTWRFAPQFGDLNRTEGGFTTKLGKFQASWARDGVGWIASVSTPAGTKGEFILPVIEKGVMPKIVLDGNVMHPKWYRQSRTNVTDLVLIQVGGGNHTIDVSKTIDIQSNVAHKYAFSKLPFLLVVNVILVFYL